MTHQKSIRSYVELYSGPQYQLDTRFSLILVFLAISFTYGTVMPLLFPIALLGYIVLFVNERIMICYFYRQPPAYGTEVTEATLNIMRLIPLVSLPFVFWQLGNRQIFENKVFEVKVQSQVMRSGHTFSQSVNSFLEQGAYA